MISVEHLTKYYGQHLAVDDLSFEIDDGHVYGFLGPNGAGKSTTMNIITGCLSATEGKIIIDGFDIFDQPIEAKKRIGYLPELPPLYLNETPAEYLRFVGEAKGLRGAELRQQIEEVINRTGIDHVKERRIGTLSKGYKQRVGIAQALLGNPSVIILDEPTVGLDPIQILEIRDLIKSLGETHTVIFSSHILSEVQTICDRILMIANGKLVAFDAPENLERQLLAHNELILTTDAAEDRVREVLCALPEVADLETEQKAELLRVSLSTELEDIYQLSRAVFAACAKSDIPLLEMRLKKTSLEDIFLELAANAEAADSVPAETPEEDGAEAASEKSEEESEANEP